MQKVEVIERKADWYEFDCEKSPSNSKILKFSHTYPELGTHGQPPRGATMLGMVLKHARGNFVHTTKISDESVGYF